MANACDHRWSYASPIHCLRCDAIFKPEPTREQLREAIITALDLIDELRSYARESWDWKYGEYWNEERAKVVELSGVNNK